jgi:predicted helicase
MKNMKSTVDGISCSLLSNNRHTYTKSMHVSRMQTSVIIVWKPFENQYKTITYYSENFIQRRRSRQEMFIDHHSDECILKRPTKVPNLGGNPSTCKPFSDLSKSGAHQRVGPRNNFNFDESREFLLAQVQCIHAHYTPNTP